MLKKFVSVLLVFSLNGFNPTAIASESLSLSQFSESARDAASDKATDIQFEISEAFQTLLDEYRLGLRSQKEVLEGAKRRFVEIPKSHFDPRKAKVFEGWAKTGLEALTFEQVQAMAEGDFTSGPWPTPVELVIILILLSPFLLLCLLLQIVVKDACS